MPAAKNPVQFYDALKARGERALKTLREHRPWTYALGVGVGGGILTAAALNVFGQWAQDVTLAGLKFAWAILKTPLWAGGGALVVLVGIVIVATWWETRPRLAKEVLALRGQLAEAEKLIPKSEPQPPPLRPVGEERDLIQDYRVIWNDYAAYPARELQSMMHSLLFTREDIYWVKLLAQFRDGLKSASDAMDSAVASDDTPLKDVRRRFNEFFNQYATAFIWLAEVRAKEAVSDASLGGAPLVERWLGGHRKLRRAVWNMSQRPEHRGQLNNEIMSFDRRAYAEWEHPIEGAFDGPPAVPSETHETTPISAQSVPSIEVPVST